MLSPYLYYLLDTLFAYFLVSFFMTAPTNLLWGFILKREPLFRGGLDKIWHAPWRQWLKLYLITTPPFWLLLFLIWNPPIYSMVMMNIARLGLLDQINYYDFAFVFWLLVAMFWYVFWKTKAKFY